MRRRLTLSAILFALTLGAWLTVGAPEAECATCRGQAPCHACTSCSSCKWCSKDGGKCGVCAPPAPTPKRGVPAGNPPSHR